MSGIDATAYVMRLIMKTPAHKLALLAIAARCDQHYSCYPSRALIAGEALVSQERAKTILRELRRDGFISARNRYRENGSTTSNRFFVHGPWDGWNNTGQKFPEIEHYASRDDRYAVISEGTFIPRPEPKPDTDDEPGGVADDPPGGVTDEPRGGVADNPSITDHYKPTTDEPAPSARSAADARRATDRSSAREAESGSAASDGAEAPKTSRSRKASSERLSRREAEAIRMVEAALPSVLVELLPKYRPPVLRDAVLGALESRTAVQLAARVERRWHAHGYADAHHSVDGKGIGSPVGVAVALVRPSVDCPDLMCEDGTTIDTGQPCRVCEERRAGRKGRRGQSPAETPVGSPVAAWWECSDCRAPVRGEKPSEDAVCRDCQAAGEAIRAALAA